MKVRWSLILFLLCLAVALGLTACDADDDDDDSDDDDSFDDDADDDDDAPDDDSADDDSADDDSADDDSADDDDDDATPPASYDPPWLVVEPGKKAAIFDELGRQVLLRGANFNHLGDYFQTDASLPTVAELSDEDWDDVAALGHNVIRLVTTWSAWEPERDEIDLEYLDRVRDAVAAAKARDMYVVIDMHQDAWSKFVFTPADEICPDGTSHQRGWDGAPLWATFTDDQPTCTPGRREDSPAVKRAWENFYADRDGIRDELVELWAFIASEFAFESAVAGYDLLNEPGNGDSMIRTFNGLTQFTRDAVAAIRATEASLGAPEHIIFFEQGVVGLPVAFDLGDDNLVFAPHNYAEAIGPSFDGLLELMFLYYNIMRGLYQAPLWVGEYNKFSDPASNDAWMTRYAELEDRWLQDGGAWWQWEQECGDPHNAMWPPTPEWIEQQQETCGDARFEIRACLDRAYARAVPGRLTSLEAVPCDGHLKLTGTTDELGEADLWIPSTSTDEPTVTGAGIASTQFTPVDGGWRVFVTVSGDYSIDVAPAEANR